MNPEGLAPKQLDQKESSVEAERDYYRLVAERLGKKSLTDTQDYSALIRNLRQTEEELRKSQEELEKKIAERTTELVRTNVELRASTSRYDELVQRIPVGVYTLRITCDGSIRFEYLSPQLCRILGLDADAALRDSNRGFDIAHPDDRDDLARTTRDAIGRLTTFRWEGRFIVRGEVRWVRIESDPVATPDGSVWNGVVSDITERKQAEAERVKLQKIEAIGILAGGIAHDFNNLLQGIFGYITMARLNMSDQGAAAEKLDQAEQAMNQAVNLTSQLLTFAKGGQPQKMKVVLCKTIENATRLALSGSGSECTLDIARDLWTTDADEGQIAQVIQNLVINASQAMQHSGTVEIAADNIDLQVGSNAALPDGGRFVRIRITDSGVGIPSQYLTKVFDPYFTTKQKGSGLGLATCYSIVKRHEGTITVHSDPGTGTTFCVYLPASAEKTERQAALELPPSTQTMAVRRQIRVLIMDDEEMVRSVAREMLEICGFQVTLAAEGEEAISKLREAKDSARPFDVVILDLTVKGGMGGEEAIRKIREIDTEVKAIVSSGYSDNPVVSDYRACGFDARLNKPYTVTALRDGLAALLAG